AREPRGALARARGGYARSDRLRSLALLTAAERGRPLRRDLGRRLGTAALAAGGVDRGFPARPYAARSRALDVRGPGAARGPAAAQGRPPAGVRRRPLRLAPRGDLPRRPRPAPPQAQAHALCRAGIVRRGGGDGPARRADLR